MPYIRRNWMVSAVENCSSKASAALLQAAGFEKNYGRVCALLPRTRIKRLKKGLGIEEPDAALRFWH
jgi:hypothetical protein